MSKTSSETTVEWRDTNWRKLERSVYKLQKRIFRASKRGDVKLVRKLQKLLTKSWSAKTLAVRRVSQDNQGKRTAGVDGVKSLTPKQRQKLVNNLRLNGKSNPTRRVWIDKPGKKEKRPLGIPTMEDRAKQALAKLALEPEWEARFEPNSYGFRPGRSCHDSIQAIYTAICKQPKYVLDADIAKCFDRIDHKALLKKLNTYPTLRRQIKAWLKAGVMDENCFKETRSGTPQGGVISPLLANVALHGMEKVIENLADTLPTRSSHGKRDNRRSLRLIRYADDFVVIHKDLDVIMRCKQEIEAWLGKIGLAIKPEKTQIVHTLNPVNTETPGFDFLGFNIRQYRVGKYHSKKGDKTLIKPSKDSQENQYAKLAEKINSGKTLTQEALIRQLNPIVRGWSNYYSTVVSKETFSRMDHLLFQKLARWGKRRHPNKNWGWLVKAYWHSVKGNNWTFSTQFNGKVTSKLTRHDTTPIKRHVKVKDTASPYDGNWTYWSSRMGKHPEITTRVATLLKQQSGKCNSCGLYFKDQDVLEIDHITPKTLGGKEEYSNFQILHRHCHDKKTSKDGSLGTQKSHNSEEPDEPKVSRPVLKTSRRGDYLA